MDNKNLFLAIVLSIVIFVGWNILSIHFGWITPTPNVTESATQQSQQQTTTASQADPNAVASFDTPSQPLQPPVQKPDMPGRLIRIETPLYTAVLNTNGGILKDFQLKNYSIRQGGEDLVSLVSKNAAEKGPLGIWLDGFPTWGTNTWQSDAEDITLTGQEQSTIRMHGEINGISIVRELTFSAENYTISENIRLESLAYPRTVKFGIGMAAPVLAVEDAPSIWARLRYRFLGGEKPVATESQYNITRVAWLQGEKFSDLSSISDLTEGKVVVGDVHWAGIMNNYFLGAVSIDGGNSSVKATFGDGLFQVIVGRTDIEVGAKTNAQTTSQPTEISGTYFFGPKVSSILSGTPNSIARSLDYGFFSVIARPLVALLQFLYSFVGNYGVAIIIMTVLIKIVFWPLSHKSFQSMERMKKLQPEMQKIREKYADDKETMNKEIMQLYKAHKVNPAGGCLPILVQIPVFFGLYQALLNAIELRHAVFIPYLPFTNIPWLTDLAAPDPFMISPLIMGASMFIQQKMSPPPGDPTQAKIMLFMPVIFTVLFINFPSGLVLYWLVNNIISIGQQRMLRSKV